MTQDLSVQNKRPSAMPYALGGAAVGGLGGYFASKNLDFTKAPKYSSWEDISKGVKDCFEIKDKKLVNKDDEVSKAILEEVRKFNEIVRSTRQNSGEESKAVTEALTARKTSFNELFGKVKNGEIKVEGLEITDKTTNKEIRNKIMGSLDKEEFKTLKEAMGKVDDARKALAKKVDDAQPVKEAADNAWNAIKDKVKDVKVPRTKMLAIGGAVLGLLVGAMLLRPKAKEQV